MHKVELQEQNRKLFALVYTYMVYIDMEEKKHYLMICRFTTDNYVQQLSWNPNKPNTMAGGYDDGSIRIWDIRNTKQPVKVLAGHSHW